jgi:hypothetical protein
MSIRWEIYDRLNSFNLFEAACLWLEIEPTNELEEDMPYLVRKTGEGIVVSAAAVIHGLPYEVAFDYYFQRRELKEIAQHRNEKPKFLYLEMRVSEKNLDEKVHPKKRNSYLKIIKGLLKKQGIDPGERGNTDALIGIVAAAGQNLRKDAIGDILKEVTDLIED